MRVFHTFFRSSNRPQNRAAVEARSTRPTRRMAAMAQRYVFIYNIHTYILIHMLLIYALHDSRIKKRRRRRQLWRSILESGFLSFKVSPPVLSKVPFVFLSVSHWSRNFYEKYCSTCNAMQKNVSFLHERTFATELIGELNEPALPSGLLRSLAICDI